MTSPYNARLRPVARLPRASSSSTFLCRPVVTSHCRDSAALCVRPELLPPLSRRVNSALCLSPSASRRAPVTAPSAPVPSHPCCNTRTLGSIAGGGRSRRPVSPEAVRAHDPLSFIRERRADTPVGLVSASPRSAPWRSLSLLRFTRLHSHGHSTARRALLWWLCAEPVRPVPSFLLPGSPSLLADLGLPRSVATVVALVYFFLLTVMAAVARRQIGVLAEASTAEGNDETLFTNPLIVSLGASSNSNTPRTESDAAPLHSLRPRLCALRPRVRRAPVAPEPPARRADDGAQVHLGGDALPVCRVAHAVRGRVVPLVRGRQGRDQAGVVSWQWRFSSVPASTDELLSC
ncbi:hypothetical protein DMC30DRAFT_271991 [Rhodotorula diobovata]|uniref:Uncharacterized protein n=1 Tax=Rhodotorula diobovata TaxID=5288 RepID=A0A5C5FWF8_9BASI|nr:hypothetical protein DMC30DRAFT_271991 [Rhodotorula diobovata]